MCVIVDSLARARRAAQLLLAAGNDAAGALSRGDLGDLRRYIHHDPVIEIRARQLGRYGLAFLIHVVRLARRIRIDADQRKAARSRGCAAPLQLRVVIVSEPDVQDRVWRAEGELLRDGLAGLEASGCELHRSLFAT